MCQKPPPGIRMRVLQTSVVGKAGRTRADSLTAEGKAVGSDMGKSDSWRTRRPRKRGFDDDFPGEGGGWPQWSPPPGGPPPLRQPSAFSSGPEAEAVVKWFNAEKGFGFVEILGGAGDAFLHASVLQRAGADRVDPGARLRVRTGPGQKGLQVTEVLEITPGEAPPPRSGSYGGGGGGGGGGGRSYTAAPDLSAAQEVRGTVKWYSAQKGFGFITPETGGKDVFVHATALERSGMPPLADGQAVIIRVVQGKKGPEAASISPA